MATHHYLKSFEMLCWVNASVILFNAPRGCLGLYSAPHLVLFLAFQNLLACFQSGSDSFSGDACEVKVAAPSHSASAEAEYWRIRAMAQQRAEEAGSLSKLKAGIDRCLVSTGIKGNGGK
eukprot:g38827.t1